MADAPRPDENCPPSVPGREQLRNFAEVAFVLLLVPFLGSLAVVLLRVNLEDGIGGTELLLVKCVEIPLSLLILAGVLRLRGQGFAQIGWRFPARERSADIKRGAAAVLPLLILAAGVSAALQAGGFDSTMPFVIDGFGEIMAFMAAGILAGGIAEEILFRGFIFERLETLFPRGRKASTVQAAFLTSLAFALPHAYEGSAAVGAILVVAFCLQLLYLASGRRLLAPMLCHALFNTVQIGLLASLSA